MMRGALRISLALTAAAMAVQGCNKPFEMVIEQYLDTSAPVPVIMEIGDSQQGLSAKSSGSVDGYSELNGHKVLVYAVSTNAEVDYRKMTEEADGVDILAAGDTAVIDTDNSLVNWINKKQEDVLYPEKENSVITYDFFASYLDDAPAQYSLGLSNSSTLVYSISIDGRQDIMTSRAVPPEGWNFGYLAACAKVNPRFYMKHDLVKLKFKLKPGVTPEGERTLYVHYLNLSSMNNAYLTAAIRTGEPGVSFYGDPVFLPLYMEDGNPFQIDQVTTVSEVEDEEKKQAQLDERTHILGGDKACFLVAPQDSYEYELGLSKYELNVIEPLRHKLALPSGKTFEAGKAYTVTFEVFGESDIAVFVDLTPWEDGGEFEATNDI